MKILSFISVAAVCTLMLSARPVQAHHGFAGRYDEVSPVTVTGTVLEFDYINPHSTIVFEVTENGKTERWQAELGAASTLHTGDGWTKETLKPGDKVTITGPRAKNGAPDMNLSHESKIVLADSGKVLHDSMNNGSKRTGGAPPAPGAPAGPAN